MISKTQALTADNFESTVYTNADNTPSRWRRNGKTKTWKTRPNDFRIPVKHGLYAYGYIDQDNATEFNVA